MRLTVYLLCISFAIFISPIWVIAGNIKIWTDENGVTHIEYQKQRSAYDYEELKQEYKKELQKSRGLRQLKRERRERKLKRINEKYDKKIKRLERKIADDRQKSEKDRAKRMIDRELKQAKRDYEFQKSQEAKYRKNYRDAPSRESRKYWKRKIDGIYDAQKRYRSLKNR